MRITEAMVSQQLLNNITNADQRRMKTHMSLSSGKRLSLPSDNPVDVVTALRYRQGISETQQYLENVRDARDWLDATEGALMKAQGLVERARDVAVMGANSHLPPGSFSALALEVRQIRDELVQVGNIAHGGRFIFSGFKTQTMAFDSAGVYQGGPNTDVITREIGPGVTLGINLTGDVALSPTIAALDQLANDLQAGNVAGVQTDIGNLDAQVDSLLGLRSQVGAKVNRLDLAEARLQDVEINLQKLQSAVEDADMAQMAVNLAREENAYQVALSSAARIVQTTLLDFLR